MLIDNSCEGLCMVNKLHQILSSDSNFYHVKIATGYWDLPGMKLMENVKVADGCRVQFTHVQDCEIKN